MMKTCEALRRRMFALAGCDWAGEVCFKEGKELSLLMDGERLTVEAPDISAAARGLFIAACALRDGRNVPELHQRRHIASCGMMLDMSRGGVMTVEAV